MILRTSVASFILLHVSISLVGIFAGFIRRERQCLVQFEHLEW